MTTTPSPFATIAKLASEHGFDYPGFEQSVAATIKSEKVLREIIVKEAGAERLLDSDSSLVVCGSFARYEMVQGSDCDWALLINGVVSNHHAEIARLINRAIAKENEGQKRILSPGTAGTFGDLTFSHDLVHRIGGEGDTNDNLTRRMLMLLESRPISFSSADSSEVVWTSVLRCILERYFEEDVHFTPVRHKVPRFLLNDLTRYWRTICVDYAAKHHEQQGRKWAIRNAKIRFSRKLLFAAGLAFCFGCELKPPEDNYLFAELSDNTVGPFIDLAMRFASTPPLEYLAAFIDTFVTESRKRRTIVECIFGSYNEWLSILGDQKVRKKLESLEHKDAANDATFKRISNLSSEFEKGLKLLFFNRIKDEHGDVIANLSLEYVGF